MKDRHFKINLFILFISFVISLPGPSPILGDTSKEPAALLKEADQIRKSLYSSPEKKKFRHNWLRVINLYRDIYTRYPKMDQTAWALYHSARLYTDLYFFSQKMEDVDEALGLHRRLVDEYQGHCLADDAQYLIGDIYNKYKMDASQAYVEFLKVVVQFPSGDMVEKARKMLEDLEVTICKKDENKEEESQKESRSELVSVTDIRHWSTPNYTRVVIDLKDPVKYSYHLLKPDPDMEKPRRLYLDLEGTCVARRLERPIVIKDGLLQLARAGQYTKDTVRVVLDMESIGGYNVFRLHDPFRIVVDVRRDEKRGVQERSDIEPNKRAPRKGIRKSDGPDSQTSLARQLGLNVRRIVIDPGHGGKDPGCISRTGIQEKDVVLRMAKTLAERIRKELRCEVFLTRTTDVFLTLEQRTAIANIKKADLFISLHINAHQNSDVWGLETYFLNMATDERSVMVAARENATSEKNISDLQTILNDLMLNTKIQESNRLAHEVQRGMIAQVDKDYKNPKDLGTKQAPFYVLIGAEMPAILVETGFITNPIEEKRLLSDKYPETIAAGICRGIGSYVSTIDLVYQGG